MINVPLLDELRAIRARLAEEQELDVERYAAMLGALAKNSGATYITEPFLPPPSSPTDAAFREAS